MVRPFFGEGAALGQRGGGPPTNICLELQWCRDLLRPRGRQFLPGAL